MIRDWIEDAGLENGNYYCRCYMCSHVFTGHKRRVVCKECDTEDKTMIRTITAIQTYSGAMFDFLDPDPDTIIIEDIAHSLSLTNRFGGHTQKAYSVAQHCVLCAQMAPVGLSFQALMHDAQEAYVGDVATPLKQLLPDYQAMEARVEGAVRDKFGLPREFDPRVKEVDTRMLATEAKHLGFHWWNSLPASPYSSDQLRFEVWGPGRSYHEFMDMFNALKP